jgi:hypothetical protein
MEGMDEKHACTDLLGRTECADHRVAQQERAQSAALHTDVDRETCQQHGRNRMRGSPRRARLVASAGEMAAAASVW